MAAMLGEIRRAVTGNRLRDGVPIYFTGNGHWSPAISDAVVVPAEEGEALLKTAQGGPSPSRVVAPYAIDVVVGNGAVNPAGLREQIRAYGPTTFRADRRVSAA